MNKKMWVLLLIATLMCCTLIKASAEKVCSFRFTDVPEQIPTAGLDIPNDAVAMAKFIKTKDSSDINGLLGVTSLMLVIDNSGSNGQSDTKGSRWSVPNALIDTLYKINPNVEIGAAVFGSDLYFDPRDESLFKKCSMGSYGYLPMLKLNETYTSSELGTKTGYEILKYYMKHAGYHLDYALTKEHLKLHTGTNISAGFRAAKDAMKDARYPKENQFVFFFSDGVASTGGNEYITATDVPTTFTIFLAPGISWPVPDEIEEMMQNITNNGYSSSNKKSAVWKMMSGHKEIMKLVVEHVIPNMITMIKMIPSQIVINSKLNDLWDGSGFTYDSLFPLTGTSTEFDYDITYERTKDSITNDGDTFTIDMGDTTHSILYDAVQAGSISDNIETRYWGRRLELYHKGASISAIDATMEEFEVRFTPYKVDTIYGYDDVSITLKTDNSTSDSEVLLLSPNGGYFSTTISRTLGAVTVGDGILQHEVSGTLFAHFSNKELPLDTLQLSIPFATPGDCRLLDAHYFDINADGFIDSITISVEGGDLSKDLDEIVDALELPSFRSFNMLGSSLNDNVISLKVEEDRTIFQTYVDNRDTLFVSADVELPSGYTLKETAIALQDRVAPVVISAVVTDSIKSDATDFMHVSFSEDIKEQFHGTPFKLYTKSSNSPYEAELKLVDFSDDEVNFEILSLSGTSAITDGDSLHIFWSVSPVISDKISGGNEQANSNNRKCEVTVITIEEDIRIHSALYFDTDANGTIDSLFVGLSGKDLALYSDTIVASLSLPAFRNLRIKRHNLVSTGLALEVEQDINDAEINTATTEDDRLILADEITLPSGNKVLTCDLSIEDKMAPIIMSATLLDSMELASMDELRLSFSEKIEKVIEEKGFRFYEMPDNKEYLIRLQDGTLNEKQMRFSVIDKNIIAHGDSICINWVPTSVTDLKSNTQDNSDNIRRQITVTIAKNEIELLGASYYDRDANGRIDEISLDLRGEKVKENLDTIVSLLKLPIERALTIDSYSWSRNNITLKVTQHIDEEEIRTATFDYDTIVVTDTVEISDKSRLLPSKVSSADKMAPIIMSGTVLDSVFIVQKGSKKSVDSARGRDHLTVTFSEEITEPEELMPFIFYSEDGDELTPELTLISHNNDMAHFTFNSTTVASNIQDDDSINIDGSLSDNIMDLLEQNQSYEENIKRPLTVERIVLTTYEPASIKWKAEASVLQYNSEESDSLMYIVLEPEKPEEFTGRDRLDAKLTIIDKVGNVIVRNQKMEENEDKEYQYLYRWDGRNQQNRVVGGKAFYAIIDAKRYFDGDSGENAVGQTMIFQLLVGVKE